MKLPRALAKIITNQVKERFRINDDPDRHDSFLVPLYNRKGQQILTVRASAVERSGHIDIAVSTNIPRNGTTIPVEELDILYNWEVIKPNSDILTITCGLLPLWHLWYHAPANLVAMLGKHLMINQLQFIADVLSKDGHIFIFTDGDKDSIRLGNVLQSQLKPLRRPCHVGNAPKRVIDLASYEDIYPLFGPL